jgi:hypothetical protein
MSEVGPIYGVELIDSLPIGDGSCFQALPSRADLDGVKNYRQGTRVVAGFEVLLNHWREQQGEINRLQAIETAARALMQAAADQWHAAYSELTAALATKEKG